MTTDVVSLGKLYEYRVDAFLIIFVEMIDLVFHLFNGRAVFLVTLFGLNYAGDDR
jgi:hypothetical protein